MAKPITRTGKRLDETNVSADGVYDPVGHEPDRTEQIEEKKEETHHAKRDDAFHHERRGQRSERVEHAVPIPSIQAVEAGETHKPADWIPQRPHGCADDEDDRISDEPDRNERAGETHKPADWIPQRPHGCADDEDDRISDEPDRNERASGRCGDAGDGQAHPAPGVLVGRGRVDDRPVPVLSHGQMIHPDQRRRVSRQCRRV